jgi:hypothetical protein
MAPEEHLCANKWLIYKGYSLFFALENRLVTARQNSRKFLPL